MTKEDKFRSECRKWQGSNKDNDALFEFSIAVADSIKQGDGLLFRQVKEIMDEEL